MNRNEEYQALLAELETVPPALETTVDRAVKRETASRRRRRVLGIPVGSLAACFTVFVLLVNHFPPFAAACGNVPLLRQLAKAVAWSPSLSAAVDNEFVQPMGLTQTENGITATIQYLIVDQKQVNLFFTLEGEGYESLSAEMPAFSPEQVCAVMGADFQKPPGTLLRFSLDYVDQDVPEGFTMTFDVTGEREAEEEPTTAPDRAYEEELLAPGPEAEPEILASFTFDLRFDPDFTAAGEVIPVHETFLLDGQTLTVTEAELYPTHLRLNFDYDPANTAWLTELNFYLENERGERFNGIVNGISATGNPDDPSTDSVWLDSPYFSTGEHLTLHVTGASWIDKGQERVKVDLAKGMIENPPQGVRLEWAEKRNAGWVVSFSAGARWEKTMHYQIWKNRFYDEDGTAHDINQRGASSSPMILGEISGAELEAYEAAEKAAKEEGRYFETFGLKDYTADCVWLEPCWTRITNSTADVVIR